MKGGRSSPVCAECVEVQCCLLFSESSMDRRYPFRTVEDMSCLKSQLGTFVYDAFVNKDHLLYRHLDCRPL